MQNELLKVLEVIDNTKRKREAPSKNLFRCPECGRIGYKKNYKNGKTRYEHVLNVKSWCIEVVDSCTVKE